MPKRRAPSRLLIPSIRTAKRTFAYSSTPFIPQPSAFNAKSFLPPEFYSGATGQPGHFSEGFCLRRVQKMERIRSSFLRELGEGADGPALKCIVGFSNWRRAIIVVRFFSCATAAFARLHRVAGFIA
jgi:hypothetical protein